MEPEHAPFKTLSFFSNSTNRLDCFLQVRRISLLNDASNGFPKKCKLRSILILYQIRVCSKTPSNLPRTFSNWFHIYRYSRFVSHPNTNEISKYFTILTIYNSKYPKTRYIVCMKIFCDMRSNTCINACTRDTTFNGSFAIRSRRRSMFKASSSRLIYFQ